MLIPERKVAALAGTLMLTATFAMADEILDGPKPDASEAPHTAFTQRQFQDLSTGVLRLMHACPLNRFLSGVQSEKDGFLCTSYSSTSTDEFQDPAPHQRPHQDQDMHACPNGFVVSGYYADQNVFLCVPSPFGNGPNVRRIVDNPPGPGNQPDKRANMHACPPGMAVAGIRNDRNQLLCETSQ